MTVLLARLVPALAAGACLAGDAPPLTTNATGFDRSVFYSFWHQGGDAAMRLAGRGRFAVDWRLGAGGNVVAGMGWSAGDAARVVRYRAAAFAPGRNGYLSLYGWSVDPLVEYYVVDDWGGFVPPGPDAASLGTIKSDGGTYRIYRTRRIEQPSIAGTATFDQYWSVRTERRPIGRLATITFAHHVAGWRRVGLRLGTLRYQIVAAEGFGSTGRAAVAVGR